MKKSEINVLIVDDDATVGRTLSEVISRAGYKASVAARGDEALNIVRLKQIHVAVIDCMLPAMNGIVLAEELRKTRFQNGAIVLMSGIFRDKSFESESIHKTGAVAFLQKPFGPSDLLAALKPVLDELAEEKQWSLQTILVRQMESVRDRVKLIEHLEQIHGVETAFVLSILMDAKLSGYLNIVTDTGGIYGLKIQAGRLASVDSEESDDVIVRFLIDTGYLTEQDWEEFSSRESSKFPLQKLVATGYISPHAALQARKDQILYSLKRILRVETVNLSFVPERSTELDSDGLELGEVFVELSQTIDALLDSKFIRDFFLGNMASPIRTLESFNQNHPIWQTVLVSRVKSILLNVKEKTLNALLQEAPNQTDEILKGLYLLVMFRQILFLDAEKLKDFKSEAGNRDLVLRAIKGKGPFEVFAYFGASAKATATEVGNIFKEFVRANHPDKLPPDAPADLREVTTAIFGIVSSAYDILSDATKRDAYQARQQAEHAEKQMHAESLAQEGSDLIRRGQYTKAEEKLNLSMEMEATGETYALLVWSRIKQSGKIAKNELPRIQKQLEEMLMKSRTSARIHMVLGLVRAAGGDPQASASFEKALSINPNFVEARREINALQGNAKEDTGVTSASDLLTGDITAIVSNLFKKKKAK